MSGEQVDWPRFELDTPQEVIDAFIENNVAECIDEARELNRAEMAKARAALIH